MIMVCSISSSVDSSNFNHDFCYLIYYCNVDSIRDFAVVNYTWSSLDTNEQIVLDFIYSAFNSAYFWFNVFVYHCVAVVINSICYSFVVTPIVIRDSTNHVFETSDR